MSEIFDPDYEQHPDFGAHHADAEAQATAFVSSEYHGHHDEPDGTSPSMIENQRGLKPGEDWLHRRLHPDMRVIYRDVAWGEIVVRHYPNTCTLTVHMPDWGVPKPVEVEYIVVDEHDWEPGYQTSPLPDYVDDAIGWLAGDPPANKDEQNSNQANFAEDFWYNLALSQKEDIADRNEEIQRLKKVRGDLIHRHAQINGELRQRIRELEDENLELEDELDKLTDAVEGVLHQTEGVTVFSEQTITHNGRVGQLRLTFTPAQARARGSRKTKAEPVTIGTPDAVNALQHLEDNPRARCIIQPVTAQPEPDKPKSFFARMLKANDYLPFEDRFTAEELRQASNMKAFAAGQLAYEQTMAQPLPNTFFIREEQN